MGGQLLAIYMRETDLSAIVLSERSGSRVVAVGLGKRFDGSGYSSRDVTMIADWAGIVAVGVARAELEKQVKDSTQIAAAGLMGAMLAHDIRTPLMAVKTYTSLLPENSGDPEFIKTFVSRVETEVGRIEGMVRQLLIVSVPKEPTITKEDIGALVRETVSILRPKAALEMVVLVDDVEEGTVAQADSALTKQVITNLVINATQALSEGTQPEKKVVVVVRKAGDLVTVDVCDNGPGVSLEQQRRLFQPFATTKRDGFGLGLPFCKKAMRDQGGSVGLEHSASGAKFRLTFKAA